MCSRQRRSLSLAEGERAGVRRMLLSIALVDSNCLRRQHPIVALFQHSDTPSLHRVLMDPNSLTTSPFAPLTFVAAPALLIIASSGLALGTVNRMLRTRDQMQELVDEYKESGKTPEARTYLTEVTDRLENQAALLLTALDAIYFALAAFASATLVTLLGAGLSATFGERWVHAMAPIGLVLGFLRIAAL